MGIKVTSQGTIPSVDLDHLQFSQLRLSVSETTPYRIALSAKCRLYGVDDEGINHYEKDARDINITDMTSFITGLPPADQPGAAQAMQKVQEGLGVLADKYLGISFDKYE